MRHRDIVPARARLRYSHAMSTKVTIEVDEQTADVLQTRAAELGVTVSELVAELPTLESRTDDRRPRRDRRAGSTLEEGRGSRLRRASGARRAMAPHVVRTAVSAVAGSVTVD
jgi:hypothetical protein